MKELRRLWKHPVSTTVGLICIIAGGYVLYHAREIDMWSGGLLLFGAASLMGKDPKFLRDFLGIKDKEDLP